MFEPTRNEEKERDVGRLNEEVSRSERGEEEKKMRWLFVSVVVPQVPQVPLAGAGEQDSSTGQGTNATWLPL